MYCSACGVAVVKGLSYCNFCGVKLNGVKGDNVSKASEVKPELLVSAMVVVFISGLIAITMLMGVMKTVLNLSAPQIIPFTLLCFLMLLSIEGVFVRLLFRRQRGQEESGGTVLSKGQATRELDASRARALPEPVPSVTEHTTRAFERIYNEPTSE
jgi:hypothetical protein